MGDTYLISKWALVRRNELVDIPDKFEIHPDFLGDLSPEEFESAFRQIHEIFYQIYTDMASEPEKFGFPLYKVDECSYFSKEAQEIRKLPWGIFYLLLCLFACGELVGSAFVVDTAEVRRMNKVKKVNLLLRALEDYGFFIDGIKNYSLSSAKTMVIDYPDNRNIITVLALIARKVMNTQLKDVNNYLSNMVAFSNGFLSWNYKVLAEDLHTCTIAEGYEYVADKIHDISGKTVIQDLDKVLTERGYVARKGDPNEGPGYRYYRTQSIYDFAFSSVEGELILELRIRNAEKCMEYLKECPERIWDMFRHTDQGCHNRVSGTCKYGVRYEFENEEKWHCGCCGAPFQIHPVQEDIPHYLKLVELGNKR